jgi:ABC-type multidrug transport system fused ATPase/permease subunit
LVFPALIGRSLDVAQGNVPQDLDLMEIGFWLILILAFQGIVSYLRVMMFAQVSERGTADIRVALYRRLISLPITFFEKSRVGELVSRLTNDIEKLYNAFYFILAEFIRQIIILVGGIAVLWWMSPKLALAPWSLAGGCENYPNYDKKNLRSPTRFWMKRSRVYMLSRPLLTSFLKALDIAALTPG